MSSLESRPKSAKESLVISSVSVNESVWGVNSHLVIKCSITDHNSLPISCMALIDSGASAHGFIDTKFVRSHNIEIIPLPHPRPLKVFDGTDSSSGHVTHIAKTTLDISGHVEQISLFVTTLAHFDIVLGLPWPQYQDPDTKWPEG